MSHAPLCRVTDFFLLERSSSMLRFLKQLVRFSGVSGVSTRSARAGGRPTRRRTFRPMCEVLENRWCPTGSLQVSLSGGTLNLTGTDGAHDVRITQDDAH